MSRKADREGLSLGYRIGYRIKVLGMHMYGPAQLGDAEDPHRRLERQRAARVAAARYARETRESTAPNEPTAQGRVSSSR
ncbi:hypothetical protein [Pedococcus bigeumensis]|uniref:Uncharacterized protein n=1 Tax=Pedococcus bigeumensis TaxID=433644 RepID=A0A502CQ56_9MICO|nr:hypothetical protein [Pedococcus bigeumensis]TPG13936.1 hypothetical protein EAH86_17075 [Pedococcus bigeumensis]